MNGTNGCGKGDTRRPGDNTAYAENYTRIFGEKPLNVWPEDDPDRPRRNNDVAGQLMLPFAKESR